MNKRLLIFLAPGGADADIAALVSRIPFDALSSRFAECELLAMAERPAGGANLAALCPHPDVRITILPNPIPLGPGGDRKLCCRYAVDSGFDVLAVFPGDGRYAPEDLPDLVRPVADNLADCVLGSRLAGLPLFHRLANRLAAAAHKWLLGARLADYLTGCRAYRVADISRVPFSKNSNEPAFDTDLLIQFLAMGLRVQEVPLPGFACAGEGLSGKGLRLAADSLKSAAVSRLQQYGIFYDPRFNYEKHTCYASKVHFVSSHSWAIERIPPDTTVLDIGCGSGHLARELKKKGCKVYGIDSNVHPENAVHFAKLSRMDANDYDWSETVPDVGRILLLDIIEHLNAPDTFLDDLRTRYGRDSTMVLLTTANVAFLPIRLSLLLGSFNYGKKGILDYTHHTLYTFASLANTLRRCGFKILEVRGIPVPFNLVFGDTALSRLLTRINLGLIRLSRTLFSFQVAMVCAPQPTLRDLLQEALGLAAPPDQP